MVLPLNLFCWSGPTTSALDFVSSRVDGVQLSLLSCASSFKLSVREGSHTAVQRLIKIITSYL